MPLEKLNEKKPRLMTSRSAIVEKTNTFPDEMVYITFDCTMHLHGK
jgi:hypothetical protein